LKGKEFRTGLGFDDLRAVTGCMGRKRGVIEVNTKKPTD